MHFLVEAKTVYSVLRKSVVKCNLKYQTLAISIICDTAEKNRGSQDMSPISVSKVFWNLEGTCRPWDSVSSSAKLMDFKTA